MTTIHARVLIARVYLIIDYSQKWVTTAVVVVMMLQKREIRGDC